MYAYFILSFALNFPFIRLCYGIFMSNLYLHLSVQNGKDDFWNVHGGDCEISTRETRHGRTSFLRNRQRKRTFY